MGNGTAHSVTAAGARTWVSALLTDASHVVGALVVAYALWPAIGRRTTELWQAGARRGFVDHLALGIWTAGRWFAWVHGVHYR